MTIGTDPAGEIAIRHATRRRFDEPAPLVDQARIDRLVHAAYKSAEPLRNTALIYVMLGTGLAQIEIALLRVSDYLNADGSVRRVSEVRADAARGRKPRRMYWASARVCRAIDNYLNQRKQLGYGITGKAAYRGLDPDSNLFLTDDGQSMCVRERPSVHGLRRRCATIQDIFSRLFAKADLKNETARDARKRLAIRLYALGADIEGIRELLGVRSRREVWKLLGPREQQRSPGERLAGLMEQLI